MAANTLAKWFKLHLHPAAMRSANHVLDVPPLPSGVSLKQVYAHLLGYLFDHTTAFFRDNSHDGPSLWQRLRSDYEIVLAIPNGWDTVQQGFLKDVVVLAGVLPDGFDTPRLSFVSEAEASVHYALDHTDGDRWLTTGTHFAVLDAGGSTVDTTLYKCTALQPKLKLEEVTSSDCVQAGAVFVDRDAEKMLRLKLTGSKFGNEEDITKMIEIFEKKTVRDVPLDMFAADIIQKRKYDGGPEPSVINFGRVKDNDASVGISKGRITLNRYAEK